MVSDEVSSRDARKTLVVEDKEHNTADKTKKSFC